MKPHVNWRHASAQQLKRGWADSGWGSIHSGHFADGVLERRVVRRAIDKGPHVPVAGTSTASMFYEILQVCLLFLGDIVALRNEDVSFIYSLLIPVGTKNPQEVWGASCSAWIFVSGQPKCIRMDEG